MAVRDVVVVGASAGGVEAVTALVSRLPADLPAALLVDLHIPADSPGRLPAILRRAGPLPAVHAGRRAPAPGQIQVAPPDRHLVVINDRARFVTGPREHGVRPAV